MEKDIRVINEPVQEQEVSDPRLEEQKDLQQKEVLQEVKKILEKGGGKEDLRCFWMPQQNQRIGLEFLMCAYMGELNAPILFHYDVRKSLGNSRQVRRIESITFSNSPTKMKFKNGELVDVPRTARLYLTTQLLKKHSILIPESNCKIEKSSKNYQLICSDKDLGEVELDKLHQNNHTALTK